MGGSAERCLCFPHPTPCAVHSHSNTTEAQGQGALCMKVTKVGSRAHRSGDTQWAVGPAEQTENSQHWEQRRAEVGHTLSWGPRVACSRPAEAGGLRPGTECVCLGFNRVVAMVPTAQSRWTGGNKRGARRSSGGSHSRGQRRAGCSEISKMTGDG